MKNLIDYIKDKIYYILGITVFLIILLIIINACSNRKANSYSGIEESMVKAAKTYYSTRKNKLHKEDGNKVDVTIGTLVDAELLKEIKDPKNKNNTCEGYVQVKKVDDDYSYIPFLTCKGNYEPKFLTDIIKDSKLDEYGNGVYEMDGEYVYRGDDVNNYIIFNNQTWRIVKVDKEGDIELVYSQSKNNERYSYDTDYNSDVGRYYGVTTDYLHTSIRKTLIDFYENNFSDDAKSKIVAKNICIAPKEKDAKESVEQECSKVKENEKIGLLRVSDYPKASLDSGCTRYDAAECTNRNYFAGSGINTWLLTAVADNTYEVYIINGTVYTKKASLGNKVYPVIYLTGNTIISSGDGSGSNEFIIK